VLALGVVVLHKAGDLGFERSWKKVVLQVHNILHGAVVTFDPALGHEVVGCAPGVFDISVFQEVLQLFGDITRINIFRYVAVANIWGSINFSGVGGFGPKIWLSLSV